MVSWCGVSLRLESECFYAAVEEGVRNSQYSPYFKPFSGFFGMLGKKNRANRHHFTAISKGKTVFSPFFSVRISNNTHTVSRFSVVVSKKVAKSAVERNSIRRKFYAALEPFKKSNFSAIFYIKKEALGLSVKQILKEATLRLPL